MKYQILDHGVENSQYFQGCGVSFTEFDNVVTGIGDSLQAALEDALEQMAQTSVSIPDELESEVSAADDTEDVPEDSEDCYHYASIRWTDENEFELIVGNIGTVYSGNSRTEVDKYFAEYVQQSKSGIGRASGENVTLMQNDEPVNEFVGALARNEADNEA